MHEKCLPHLNFTDEKFLFYFAHSGAETESGEEGEGEGEGEGENGGKRVRKRDLKEKREIGKVCRI